MTNIQKIILIGANVLLSVALIALLVILFNSGQNSAKVAQQSFAQIQNELSSIQFAAYEDGTISGSQVISAIRKYANKDQFGIRVTTGKGATSWYHKTLNIVNGVAMDVISAGSDIRNITNETLDTYINPLGEFKADIVYDQNNVVRGILFEQKK